MSETQNSKIESKAINALKQVHLVETSGVTGIDSGVKELWENYPDVTLVEGKRIYEDWIGEYRIPVSSSYFCG